MLRYHNAVKGTDRKCLMSILTLNLTIENNKQDK